MKTVLSFVSLAAWLFCSAAGAQTQPQQPTPPASTGLGPLAAPATAPAQPTPQEIEQRELSQSLAEAGNSPIDFIRALEQHLKKYPNATDRPRIEKALSSAAINVKDDRRTVLYGEKVLAVSRTDIQLLEQVASALLRLHEDRESAEKAYSYAFSLENQLNDMVKQTPPDGMSDFRWHALNEHRLGGALRIEAQAQGVMGKIAEAIALAKRAYEINPSGATAREWGRWVLADGKTADAISHYADAFTLEDPESTEEDRARDRAKMGELYRKVHKSEKGLGDLILQAYDRTSILTRARLARVREGDPNLQAKAVLDFTLPGANTDALKMATLKGKTVVVDFWATWCQPCRLQRPMYEQVEKKYQSNPNVVFLSVNTDEDRSKIPEFLTTQKWTQHVYYDAGLGAMLRVASIPTTIVLDPQGQIYSRMAGFIPDRFVDMLTQRIEETLHAR